MTPESLMSLIQSAGAVGVISLFLVMLLRGDILLRREGDALRQDRDMWRRIATEGNTVAKRAVEVAEVATKRG